MIKKISILCLLLVVMTGGIQAQCGGAATAHSSTPTSLGMVISSNDVETIWNALRLANYSKSQGDTVSIFLLGKGVELDELVKKDTNLNAQANKFYESGGKILGCGTCLASRKNNTPQVCKYSSMSDLYEIIRKSKVLLTF